MTLTTTDQLRLRDWFVIAPTEERAQLPDAHFEMPFRVKGLQESENEAGVCSFRAYTQGLCGSEWSWGPDIKVYLVAPPSDPVALSSLQPETYFVFSPTEFSRKEHDEESGLRRTVYLLRWHAEAFAIASLKQEPQASSLEKLASRRLVYPITYPLVSVAEAPVQEPFVRPTACNLCDLPFHPGRPEIEPYGFPSGLCADCV